MPPGRWLALVLVITVVLVLVVLVVLLVILVLVVVLVAVLIVLVLVVVHGVVPPFPKSEDSMAGKGDIFSCFKKEKKI